MNNLLFQGSNIEITTWDVVLRLLISFVAGFIIGLERGKHQKVLSLRPHILITVGSTLIMLVSIYMSQNFGVDKNYDPGRIAAQVVSGIGFLGAGAIIRMGVNVKGLTTATAIWVASAVGLAIGAGFYLAALVGVAIILIVLIYVEALEKSIFKESIYKIVSIKYKGLESRKKEILSVLDKHNVRILTVNMQKNYENQSTSMNFQVHIASRADTETICNQLAALFQPSEILSVNFNNME